MRTALLCLQNDPSQTPRTDGPPPVGRVPCAERCLPGSPESRGAVTSTLGTDRILSVHPLSIWLVSALWLLVMPPGTKVAVLFPSHREHAVFHVPVSLAAHAALVFTLVALALSLRLSNSEYLWCVHCVLCILGERFVQTLCFFNWGVCPSTAELSTQLPQEPPQRRAEHWLSTGLPPRAARPHPACHTVPTLEQGL